MSEPEHELTGGPAPPAPPDPHRRLRIEIGVVLCLAVLPDAYNALVAVISPGRSSYLPSFELSAGSIVMRSVMVAAPLLYILHLNGDGLASVGIRRPRPVVDIPLGIGVYIADLFVYMALAWVVFWMASVGFIPSSWLFEQSFADMPNATGAWPLALLVMAVCNAFAEELVMRGYLIPRLERLWGNTFYAILATSLLFAAYHIYQGAYGVVSAVAFGLLMGLIFVWTRRLWPCFVAHFLSDTFPFVWHWASDAHGVGAG
jgi:membrane protease YdiL (CAAX protease family)